MRSEVESEVFILKYSTAGCEEERRERERIKRGVTRTIKNPKILEIAA